MSIKKRGLGHNSLDVLLATSFTPGMDAAPSLPSQELALNQLQPGRYQPRRHMADEALAELAASIQSQGVIQPLIVRPVGNQKYEIIAGERRFRASKLAGLTHVPVVIREVNDHAALAMALIENIQREDLNPMEEALSLKRLMDEFELSHEEVAKVVGKSRSAVTNLLRLLHLHPEVKILLERGQLELGHAKVLLGISGELQVRIAKQVALSGWTVRETEEAIRKAGASESFSSPSTKVAMTPELLRVTEDLADRLAAKVQLKHEASGKGRLVIQYNSVEELEGILAHIK